MSKRTFQFSQWGTVDPKADWQFAAGFFAGSGKTDLFGYHPSNGTLWVGANIGTGLTFTQWGKVEPAAGWQFVADDFIGNGRTHIVGYHSSNGTLWLGENLGNRFSLRQWGIVEPKANWQFAAGVFTGSGKADLFGYHPSNGTLWVGKNTGTGFIFQQWGTVDPLAGWQFVASDFTGNGRTDVGGYHPSNGSVWIGKNLGRSFSLRQWGTVAPKTDWNFAAGFFTGRGKADLFGYHPSNGTLWVGENPSIAMPWSTVAGTHPTEFAFNTWGKVEPAAGWQFVAGMFDGDLWADVIGYHPSNGTLWLGKSSVHPIEGYCWPLSAAPGENISFMISGEGLSRASFMRHTSTSSLVESVQMQDLNFTPTSQEVMPEVWRSGCKWNETFGLNIPSSWPSGIYSASCMDAENTNCDITFIVKPNPSQRSRIAVLANVNTWLAYNGWGGQSKYSGLARTSFLRPNPGAAPKADFHLTRGELWISGWLESAGHRPDIFTDIDFHNEGCDASQYRCLVLSTHPEYWTTQMYDNLAAYLDAGGSVAYLGGNGIYENGEYDTDQTAMVFRVGVEGGPRVDALFRVLSPARAERSILGVATERCGAVGSAYKVEAADHPLFSGIRLKEIGTGAEREIRNGDLFGETGLNTGFGNGKASAWEVDTSSGVGATSVPINCATESKIVPSSSLPSGLIVLARGEPDGQGFGADMVFYNHPGGGFVFSVGSITFGGSLVVDPVIQQMMRNVLTKADVLT